MTNRQWLLAARPHGDIQDSDFRWNEADLAPLGDGQIRVRNIWLSLDPTNRIWMNEADSYLPAIPLGDVMRGGAIGVVEESKNPRFAAGDIVQGLGGWQLFATGDGTGWTKLPPLPGGLPLSTHFGAMGHIGFTAYFGVLDLCQPKAGETLVVTAAAGAVGSIAGQIGKLQGCRVVGIAGSDDKCKWLVDGLGFDAAINYKTEDVGKALDRHCPKGIDMDFENVGGPIFDQILMRINKGARIALCGMISQYNADRPQPGPYAFTNLLIKSARLAGFIVMDYTPRFPEAAKDIVTWILQGKLKYKVDVVEGLENAPRALRRLFDGSNTGKLVVRISPEPK